MSENTEYQETETEAKNPAVRGDQRDSERTEESATFAGEGRPPCIGQLATEIMNDFIETGKLRAAAGDEDGELLMQSAAEFVREKFSDFMKQHAEFRRRAAG